MKKSEMYNIAIGAVIDDNTVSNDVKIPIIAMLMENKSIEEYKETQEAKNEVV